MAKDKAETAQTPGKDVAAPGASTAVAAPSNISPELLMQDARVDLGFRAEDVAIPFLKVAQKMSPEISKRDPGYIEGLEEGDFFNTVTRKLFKGGEGIVVIPISFTPSYIEWRPRDSGGGIVKDHKADDSLMAVAVRNEKNKLVLPNGNHLVQSAMYYAYIMLNVDEGLFEPVVINLAGTQLKKGRRWNSLIQSILVENPNTHAKYRPAPFYKSYEITTVPEKNDQGEWMGVKIEPGADTLTLPQGDRIYLSARDFRDLVKSGKAKAKVEDSDNLGELQPDAGGATAESEKAF